MRRVRKAAIWLGWSLALALAAGSAAAEAVSDVPKAGAKGEVGAASLPAGNRQGNAVGLAKIVAALDNVVAPAPSLSASIGASHSAQLYRQLSPLVVLVVTDDGLGSGSIITSDGYVLTNNHVIIGFDTVGVIVKPQGEGDSPSEADAYAADVVKLDEVADLALLKIRNWPDSGYIELGSADAVSVGDDVHAIGHPKGETWTYTKGVISAMRRGYNWTYDNEFKHQADVIQTQTPINPGNSGGPLFDDEGRLIGVNSFGDEQSQGLNFAVSVREVVRFMNAAADRYAEAVNPPAQSQECAPVVAFTGRTAENDADIRMTDDNCDGYAETVEVWYDDPSRGYVVEFDDNQDGRWETAVYDSNNDGRWDYSLYDTDADGNVDLRGLHPDGGWDPSEYQKV